MRKVLGLMLGVLLLAGCNDDNVVAPRAVVLPAAPRGLQTVTGDHTVYLSWLKNTESSVVSYRIYTGPCPDASCSYTPIGSTSTTSFVVTGLTNGQTAYYAVAAVNRDGRESDLSYDTIYDTPRPEGFGLTLGNAAFDSLHAGYDFSTYSVLPYRNSQVDVFYGAAGGQNLMIAPFADTEIQDAGYGETLDAVDFAPVAGWSPTGTVELVPGHCYVVWTQDNHYAKFRVSSLTSGRVVMDWAYQVAAGNRELKARPEPSPASNRVRRPSVWGPLAAS